MRFLAIVPEAFGGFGGIAVYNRDFLTALAELKLCEKMTVLPRLIRQERGALPRQIELIENAANSRVRYTFELLRLLSKRERYDVVLCGHINLLPLAVIANRLLGAKLVLLIYGIDAWSPTGRRISDRLVGCADLVVSISQITKQRFMSWSSVPDKQVHLLPNAIHMNDYGIGEKPGYLEQRYGLSGKKVLMTLARLQQSEQQKGVDEMLELLPSLLTEEKNISYLIAGDGDDRPRLGTQGERARTQQPRGIRGAGTRSGKGRSLSFGRRFSDARAAGGIWVRVSGGNGVWDPSRRQQFGWESRSGAGRKTW